MRGMKRRALDPTKHKQRKFTFAMNLGDVFRDRAAACLSEEDFRAVHQMLGKEAAVQATKAVRALVEASEAARQRKP